MRISKKDLEETKKRLAPYMKCKETTADLRKCCEKCEKYRGNETDYNQCECPILEMWYEKEYLSYYASWVGAHDMNY